MVSRYKQQNSSLKYEEEGRGRGGVERSILPGQDVNSLTLLEFRKYLVVLFLIKGIIPKVQRP